jgi:hypothetical protein
MTLHQEKCLFKKKAPFPGWAEGPGIFFFLVTCVCVRHKYVLYYVLFIFISINSIYSFICVRAYVYGYVLPT